MNFIKKILYGLIKKNRHLPMDYYAKIFYEYYHDKKLDLTNPIGFNQKIQWLKVYFHLPILNRLADKYAVRSFIKEQIGSKYLNDIYGVYTSYSEIDFESLPKRFVIKGTHASNMHLVVMNKETLDHADLKRKIKKWKGKNLFYTGGQEWVYKNIKPRIIIEKYMDGGEMGLIDYRFFCFSGEPKFIQVHVSHNGIRCGSHYDLEWKKMDVTSVKTPVFPNNIPRPKGFDEMIEVVKKISDKFPFVRVDLYNNEGEIKFGEMTFYPADGRMQYEPKSFDRTIGDFIQLPEIPVNEKEITSL